VKLLLDSHAFVWSAIDRSRLSARVRDLIADRENEVFVSAATAYELELKRSRDTELARLPHELNEAVEAQSFVWLPIEHTHAASAGRLPRLHGDPFDRIIIAQAISERATVISLDRWFAAYGLPVTW
jgi:PIN domain nuclease of toxin-antitoxin system